MIHQEHIARSGVTVARLLRDSLLIHNELVYRTRKKLVHPYTEPTDARFHYRMYKETRRSYSLIPTALYSIHDTAILPSP
jgi:hypothetical protein